MSDSLKEAIALTVKSADSYIPSDSLLDNSVYEKMTDGEKNSWLHEYDIVEDILDLRKMLEDYAVKEKSITESVSNEVKKYDFKSMVVAFTSTVDNLKN